MNRSTLSTRGPKTDVSVVIPRPMEKAPKFKRIINGLEWLEAHFFIYFYEHDSFRLSNLTIIYCIGRALNTCFRHCYEPEHNHHPQQFSGSVSFFNSDNSLINLFAFQHSLKLGKDIFMCDWKMASLLFLQVVISCSIFGLNLMFNGGNSVDARLFAKSKENVPKYQLVYFDRQGRAEISRWMFAYGGIHFSGYPYSGARLAHPETDRAQRAAALPASGGEKQICPRVWRLRGLWRENPASSAGMILKRLKPVSNA